MTPCRACHGHGGTWIPDGPLEHWHPCPACGCTGDELGGEG